MIEAPTRTAPNTHCGELPVLMVVCPPPKRKPDPVMVTDCPPEIELTVLGDKVAMLIFKAKVTVKVTR